MYVCSSLYIGSHISIHLALLCPALVNITHGHVLVSGFTPGSTAMYSCEIGYTLNGTGSRTCQENGEWSEQEPICEGKSKSYLFENI